MAVAIGDAIGCVCVDSQRRKARVISRTVTDVTRMSTLHTQKLAQRPSIRASATVTCTTPICPIRDELAIKLSSSTSRRSVVYKHVVVGAWAFHLFEVFSQLPLPYPFPIGVGLTMGLAFLGSRGTNSISVTHTRS